MIKKHLTLILAILVPPVSLMLVLGFASLPFGKRIENVTLDARFAARADSDPDSDPRILPVGISEQGLEQFGRWPWSRSVHGQFLQLLSLRPPKSIAFDILFTEKSPNAEDDVAFANGLILHPGAITGSTTEDLGHLSEKEVADSIPGNYIGNTPALTNITGDISKIQGDDFALMPVNIVAESSLTGFVNVQPSDVDGLRRKSPLVIRSGSLKGKAHIYPSLVLQILMQNEGLGPDDVEIVLGEHVRIKGKKESWKIPVDDAGQMFINYRGTTAPESNIFEKNEISYFGLVYFLQNYAQALETDPKAEWPREYKPDENTVMPIPKVQDQFLIIGQTALGLTDFGPTPMGSQTPLMKVHATLLNNILQGDYLSVVPVWIIALGLLLISWATLVPLRNSAVWLSISVPVVIVGSYIAIAFYAFSTSSLHIPIVWPVVGFMVAHGTMITNRLVTESKAKGRIKAMFSTYVAPEVVEQLIESGEEPKLGGEEIVITPFFSDIQSFSAFSEILTPTQLVALMNEYLSEMSYILKYAGSGTLDKFIGDAIVGIFGAPLHYPDHAHRACITAIQMQKRQAELRDEWKESGEWPEIVIQMRTRIGLNTGPAVVGNMGAKDRMNYTMMGDTVNLAARCESGAKSYGVYTMVTGETKSKAEEAKDDLAFRFLDKIIVKGRTTPVEMYELIGFTSELSAETEDCIANFESGVEKYLNQDWDGASALFQNAELLELARPGDPGVTSNPSIVLIDRCEKMKATPPGDDWDGVYVMTSK